MNRENESARSVSHPLLTPQQILQFQRQAGNQAVLRLLGIHRRPEETAQPQPTRSPGDDTATQDSQEGVQAL